MGLSTSISVLIIGNLLAGKAFGTTCPPNYPSLITFDNIANTSLGGIGNGYGNLSWSNVIFVAASSQQPGSGYYTALSSGSYVASNGFSAPMNISKYQTSGQTSTFHVGSFVAAGAWNNNLQLTIAGVRNGSVIYNQTVTLQTATPLLITLNWTDIEVLMFNSFGGTHANNLNTWGSNFAMDDLCVFINFSSNTNVSSIHGQNVSISQLNTTHPSMSYVSTLETTQPLPSIPTTRPNGGNRLPAVGIGAAIPISSLAGIVVGVIVAVVVIAIILWLSISSQCFAHSPHC